VSAARSAGILLFRRTAQDGAAHDDPARDGPASGVEVLIAHPGGPFWSRKDAGAWSIPKGEYDPSVEAPEDAARREFAEELGMPVPAGELLPLGEVRQTSGKVVTAWALEGDLDPDRIDPGTFELTWPPRSGRVIVVPEVDRVAWVDPATARGKLVPAQAALLDRLLDLLSV